MIGIDSQYVPAVRYELVSGSEEGSGAEYSLDFDLNNDASRVDLWLLVAVRVATFTFGDSVGVAVHRRRALEGQPARPIHLEDRRIARVRYVEYLLASFEGDHADELGFVVVGEADRDNVGRPGLPHGGQASQMAGPQELERIRGEVGCCFGHLQRIVNLANMPVATYSDRPLAD